MITLMLTLLIAVSLVVTLWQVPFAPLVSAASRASMHRPRRRAPEGIAALSASVSHPSVPSMA